MSNLSCASFRSWAIAALAVVSAEVPAQVDYSVVSVPQESGTDFTCITTDNDYVCMPMVRRSGTGVAWLSNRILDISVDGTLLAYLSARNETTNIFIKDINRRGSSVQRTNRRSILDFSYSPDGKYIVFSEKEGKTNQIYQTDARAGYVCRQMTSGNQDYSPIYSRDMKQVFFARQEVKGVSIWSHSVKDNFLSSYTRGMNPCPTANTGSLLCTRLNAEGRGELWRVNYATGMEECVLSDARRSFTSPTLSPDGQWILCTGSSVLLNGTREYWNTDIYVCRTDGTGLLQLTYHAADDLSPVWSRDGHYIYFISQRGSADGTANVWRMKFNH